MAGTDAGDRARRDARGGAARSHPARGNSAVRHPPDRGGVARDGVELDRRAGRPPGRGGRPRNCPRLAPPGGCAWGGGRRGSLPTGSSALAARHALPAVYPGTYFVTSGGLISYSADSTDPHRRAAGYVDRILKGEKPANLPVQNPVKYELAVNLKTAKALGFKIPDRLLA